MVKNVPSVRFSIFATDHPRLDTCCARLLHVSRSDVQRWIEKRCILVNCEPCKPSLRLTKGDEVTVDYKEALSVKPTVEVEQRNGAICTNRWTIPIVYSDDDLMVINKPFGLLVHAAQGNHSENVVGILQAAGLPLAMGKQGREGIVHRLDQFTEGLMLIAKTEQAVEGLRHQFKHRKIAKRYYAVLKGVPSTLEGKINRCIGRDATVRARRSCHYFVEGTQKEAITHYKVCNQWSNGCFVDVQILTGRTHQIRVHFASLNCPVLGDSLYSNQPKKQTGYFLQSYYLAFVHPYTHNELMFELPVSDRLKKYAGQHKTC